MIFPIFAAIGAWLAANVVQIALVIASMVYQRRRQKKLAAELDKQKGFDLVVDGDPIHLPLIYGTQKVGGVRTYHQTYNEITTELPTSNFDRFAYPVTKWPETANNVMSGSKHQYLITQQALCFGGIDSVLDIEVNSQSWNKGKFSHQIEVSKNGGVANPTATATGIPDTNKFTNTAWINAAFWLDRNDYNYQGVPNISAYVKGQRVWTLKESGGNIVLDQKVYSNNNAYVLMDYLLRPKNLGGCGFGGLTVAQWYADTAPSLDLINLESIYNSANICDTTVETITNVRGRVNGVPPIDRRVATTDDLGTATEAGETVYVEDIKKVYVDVSGTWSPVGGTRTVKLYECNITIDTERSFRDNIELLLETMGEAELIFTEGQYKLILNYPEDETEQDAVLAATYDDSYIVSEDITVSYPGASDRYNRVVVKFNNEEHDFATDSVSWPQYGDANHQKLLAEDNGVESTQEIFLPGCSIKALAAAKAENMVRQSRLYIGDATVNPATAYSLNQRLISLTLDRRAMVLETGDLFKLNSEMADIDGYVFRVETIKYTSRMNVEVTASQFNYTNLSYSDKSFDVPDPRFRLNNEIPNVKSLTYHSDQRTGGPDNGNGYLSWNKPDDVEVRRYHVYTSLDNSTWEELGSTGRKFFDIPAEYDDGTDRYFAVRVETTGRRMNEGVVIFVDSLQTISPLSSVTLVPIVEGMIVSWENPTPAITRHHKVYYSYTSTKPATAAITTKEQTVNIQPLSSSGPVYVWVDVVGYNGSVGAMASPASATALVPTVDISEVFETPDDPSGLSVTSSLASEGKSEVTVTWSEPSNTDYVASYRIKIVDVTNSKTVEFPAVTSPYRFLVDRGLSLTVTVEAVNGAGEGSGYLTPVSHTAATDSVAPAVPSSVSATAGFNTIWVEWSEVADSDLSYYEVCAKSSSGTPATNPSSGVYKIFGTSFVHSGLADDTTKYYYVRAIDTSGNKSAWSTVASASTSSEIDVTVTSEDIAGLVDSTSFADGLSRIGIANTLPSDNTDYDGVVLTTDSKLYRWNGIEFTNEVDGEDLIVDSVKSGSIATGAIKAEQIDAGAVVATKLGVGDFTNFVAGSSGMWDNHPWEIADDANTTVVTNTDHTGENEGSLNFWGSSTITRAEIPRIIDVVEDEEIYVEFWVLKSPTFNGNNNSKLRIANAADDTVVYAVEFNGVTSGVWTKMSGSFTIGSGVTGLKIALWSTNTAGYARVDDMIIRKKNGGEMIIDGSLKSNHVGTNVLIANTANIANSVITDAHITNLSANKLYVPSGEDGIPATITVGTSGTTIGTVESRADDPAARVNAKTTQIDPGKILISGNTTLSDWRHGDDLTTINGGSIKTNTIEANKLTIGNRGVSVQNVEFEAHSNNTVSWTSGGVRYVNDNGVSSFRSVSANSATHSGNRLYIYFTKDQTDLRANTDPTTAGTGNNVILATYAGGTDLTVNYGQTIIDGAHIKTGTIDATHIQADAITSDHIQAGTISANKLTLGDPANVLDGGNMEDSNTIPWDVSVTGYGIATNNFYTGSQSLRVSTDAPTSNKLKRQTIPVTPGDKYMFSVWVKKSSDWDGDGNFKFRFSDGSSGSHIYSMSYNGGGNNVWKQLTKELTIPSGTTSLRIDLWGGSGTTGYVYLDDVRFHKMTDGELIVNGTIHGDKLTANTVSADSVIIDGLTLSRDGDMLKISNGGVDTTQLSNGAVSVVAANSKGSDEIVPKAIANQWEQVLTTGNQTWMGGKPLLIMATLNVESSFGVAHITYRIKVNGSVVYSDAPTVAISGTYWLPISVAYQATSVSGTHAVTIETYVSNDSNGDTKILKGSTIAAFELKK